MTVKARLAAGAAVLGALLPSAAPPDASALRVRVPLDRADPHGARIALAVERVRATERRRGTVLFLSGGPGEAATPHLPSVAALLGRRLRRGHDVVAFDARGSGFSGLLRCPELQRDRSLRATSAAATCAQRLGRRGHYNTTADQVADVEDVRRALGIERMDLYAVSFGTEVALRYAQAHPDRVGRLVLDSVLPPEGPSALGLEVFAGMGRVLDELCARRRCAPGVPPPRPQLAALVARLREGPLTAPVHDARGRARNATLDPVGVFDLLLEGDFSAVLRAALPAALAAAAGGDAAPLLRLDALARRAASPPPARGLSAAAYAATSCTSLDLPWDPHADPATRRAQAAQRLREVGEAPFAPFSAEMMLEADFLSLCMAWPAPLRPPVVASPAVPAVPMLLLAGAEDLRTPVESARRVLERNPRARLLAVPGTGHSVVLADETGCAQRALQRFLARLRPPARCAGPRPYAPPVPVPPPGADALPPAPTVAARVRRTLRAVDLTLDDVTLALALGPRRGGGLRGGSYAVADGAVRLRRYAYVPGVVVEAAPGRRGTLRIRVHGPAAARGRLRIDPAGRYSGRLAGRRVRGRMSAGPPIG